MRHRAVSRVSPPAPASGRRLAWAGVAFVLGVGVAGRAHGPAPAALEVLTGPSGAPGLVRTNLGLAARLPDGTYEHVCPSRWDGNERALATAGADGREVVVHSAGVMYHSRYAGCAFEPSTPESLYVTATARWGSGFVAVAEDYPDDLDPDRSRLFGLRDARLEELAHELGVVDGALGAGERVVLAGARPRPFVASLALDGTIGSRELALEGGEIRRLTPRATEAGSLWLLAREARLARLVGLSDERIEEGPEHDVIHGPVRVGGRWWAVFDGVLHAHSEGGWSALEAVPWTCLAAEGASPYACSLEGVFELRDDGAGGLLAVPSFSLRQLGPPRECGTAEQVAACRRDWAHFGGESGWLGSAPARTPTEARRPLPMGSCAVRASAARGAWLVALGLACVRARASRARRSR